MAARVPFNAFSAAALLISAASAMLSTNSFLFMDSSQKNQFIPSGIVNIIPLPPDT
jgi:hypothetical protein